MTPREIFTFASKLRTSLNENEIDAHVSAVLKRLRLEMCADTRIGAENFNPG